MISDSAVILVLRDAEQVSSRPLLLRKLLFSPVAAWLRKNLQRAGVARFFVIAEPDLLEETAACFPADAEVCSALDEGLEARLTAFAAAGQGRVITVTQPVFLNGDACRELTEEEFITPAGDPMGVYRVEAEALAQGGIDGLVGSEYYSPYQEQGVALLEREDGLQLAKMMANGENLRRLLESGVEMLDTGSVYLDPDVEVGAGTLLLPGTMLRGHTVIGEDCEIGPNSMIRDCVLGDGCVASNSHLTGSTFGKKVNIGPFAYVRPGTHVGDGCKVGDFTELKNATLGAGTKIPHLIYVGDADVGERCNFGCGSITCNYDGNQKFRTTVGDDCFIGCNTNLVAPCTVEDGAYTAAGTTITSVAPKDSLVLSRLRPTVKEGWAAEHRAKKNR
ncbi:MAG: UDP-N-acetylglucosamine diphosphorylase [Clostridiales bacterium]|nr:UDP-N-acetylglucosamine diphosphorylase [Clostridiales bacterium]